LQREHKMTWFCSTTAGRRYRHRETRFDVLALWAADGTTGQLACGFDGNGERLRKWRARGWLERVGTILAIYDLHRNVW
jgi:hypothetical protein